MSERAIINEMMTRTAADVADSRTVASGAVGSLALVGAF
jgi:hypothetical protein